MKRLLPLALLLACTSSRRMMLPDGTQGYYVKCRTEEACFIRAGRVCPYGYRVVHAGEQSRVVVTSTTARARSGVGSMLIRCGADE